MSFAMKALFVAVIPPERLPAAVRDSLGDLVLSAIGAVLAVQVVDALRDSGGGGGLLTVVLGILALTGVAMRTRSLSMICGSAVGIVLLVDLALPTL